MDKDTFILKYLEDHAIHGMHSPFILHVRIATHGSVTLANCHPFIVPSDEGDTVMMHNGIISNMDDAVKGTDLTDTQGLIANVLVDLKDTWLDSPYLCEYIEEFIGYSKLVFLTNNSNLDYDLYILNEDLGVWHKDIWYSNYAFFKTEAAATPMWKTPDSILEWWGEQDEDNDLFDYPKEEKLYGSQLYGWYRDGVYQEGTYKAWEDEAEVDDKVATPIRSVDDETFEHWLQDADCSVDGSVLVNPWT